MDPRHPELAISRMRELMKQYDRIEADMNKATTSAQLGQLEREGGLVVQEICLVAPRIHEAMMQSSRQRRHDLTRGFFPEVNADKLEKPTKEAVESYVKKLVEKPVEKSQEKCEQETPKRTEKCDKTEVKPVKSKAKKTTKKAKK